MSQMLQELANSLPRFRAYTEIFHTPALHQALREVYHVFLDFCAGVTDSLRSDKCCE